jgi:sialate O-acetylesterase
MPANWKGKRLYLELGYVDDADEVYLNGHFIAFQGAFPPNFVTRYNVARQYAIPLYALQPDADNLIAVRVYDDQMAGGITHGNIRLVEDQNPLQVDQSLEGIWKLHKGDDMAWKEPLIDERGWIGAQVPSFWETQGLYGHDGFAWYRKTFTVDPKLESEKLILFMGKIDDFDEVYLNGQRVGRSGTFHSDGTAEGGDDVFKQWRAYTLPVGAVKSGTNVIAVRVYDKYYHGGIYEGPIGLVRRSTYANWQPRKTIENRWQSPWRFLEWLFN